MSAMQMLTQPVGDNAILQPACPSCGRALHLSRITPGTGGLADLRTYACRTCGVWVTEADDRTRRQDRG
jgi:hypothetical protein